MYFLMCLPFYTIFAARKFSFTCSIEAVYSILFRLFFMSFNLESFGCTGQKKF